MIVDQAEEDCEVVQDPFLEAGITIPSDLPYQDQTPEKCDQKDIIELKMHVDGAKVDVWIHTIYSLVILLSLLIFHTKIWYSLVVQ